MRLKFKNCFQNLTVAKVGGCSLALALVLGMTGFVYAQNDATLVVDGKTTHLKTFAPTVGALLKENNIQYDPGKDKVKPPLSTKIKDEAKIVVSHGVPITIELNEVKIKTYTTTRTIEGALKQAGIKVSSEDTVIPDRKKLITENAWIIVRYTSKIIEAAQSPIPFQAINQNDPNLEKGKQRIVTQGKEGKLLQIYEVLSSGERKLIGRRVLSPPVNQIVSIGTKKPSPTPPVTTALASIAVSRGGGRTLTMVATAYTPGYGCGYTTATGRRAKRGIVAVDPGVIPLGTRVHVSGYGTAIAADTGSAIKGNRIDVCVGSYSEAMAWGRRTVTVTVY